MDQVKIGAFLKKLRKEKNLTQEQLAEEMGVSARTISRWETGNNMPDISLLIALADFYDVDLREILNGERKSETMTEETREVLTQTAEYIDAEKKKMLKDILLNSVLTFVCWVLSNIGYYFGLQNDHEFFNFLFMLGMAAQLIFVLSTILAILKISGSMGKNAARQLLKTVRVFSVVITLLCAACILLAFLW